MGGGTTPCTLSLSWNSSYPLQFGKFAANSGGTIVVSNSADTATTTGGVFSFTGGIISRARFNLTCSNNSGDTSSTYTITTDSSTTLSSGGSTMTLNNFTLSASTGAPTGTITNGGATTLYVGGTLNASANQPAGSYSGSFNVTVNYP